MEPTGRATVADYHLVGTRYVRELLGMEVVGNLPVTANDHTFSLGLCLIYVCSGGASFGNNVQKVARGKQETCRNRCENL